MVYQRSVSASGANASRWYLVFFQKIERKKIYGDQHFQRPAPSPVAESFFFFSIGEIFAERKGASAYALLLRQNLSSPPKKKAPALIQNRSSKPFEIDRQNPKSYTLSVRTIPTYLSLALSPQTGASTDAPSLSVSRSLALDPDLAQMRPLSLSSASRQRKDWKERRLPDPYKLQSQVYTIFDFLSSIWQVLA